MDKFYVMIFREPATHQIEVSVDSYEDGIDFLENPNRRYEYKKTDLLALMSEADGVEKFRYGDLIGNTLHTVWGALVINGDYHVMGDYVDELNNYDAAWNTFWHHHTGPQHLMQLAHIWLGYDSAKLKNAYLGILRSKKKSLSSDIVVSKVEKTLVAGMLAAIKSNSKHDMAKYTRDMRVDNFSWYGRAVAHAAFVLCGEYDRMESVDDINEFFYAINDTKLNNEFLRIIRRNVKLEDILAKFG